MMAKKAKLDLFGHVRQVQQRDLLLQAYLSSLQNVIDHVDANDDFVSSKLVSANQKWCILASKYGFDEVVRVKKVIGTTELTDADLLSECMCCDLELCTSVVQLLSQGDGDASTATETPSVTPQPPGVQKSFSALQ